jgi:hypothetical protein
VVGIEGDRQCYELSYYEDTGGMEMAFFSKKGNLEKNKI